VRVDWIIILVKKEGMLSSSIRRSRSVIKRCVSNVVNNRDLRAVYAAQTEVGNLRHDDRQAHLIKQLNKLNTFVSEYAPPPRAAFVQLPPTPPPSEQTQVPSSATKPEPDGTPAPEENRGESSAPAPPPAPAPRRLKGMYIYGHVGVGKSMVMDLFYNHCPISAKRRVHFHKFMLEIHQRIHLYKKKLMAEHGRDVHLNLSSERDAIATVAHDIADECVLLCFDEFQVTDICDAMILTKFFGVLWERGTVLVATSNRPPDELYKDGLNRHYFLPFIDRLTRECVVWDMEAHHDYRQQNVALANAYYTPVNEATTKLLWDDFLSSSRGGGEGGVGGGGGRLGGGEGGSGGGGGRLGGGEGGSGGGGGGQPVVVDIPVMMGRTVKVTVCDSSNSSSSSSSSSGSTRHRACWVDFKYLCEGDRFASDYKAICEHFDQVFLHGVPQLSVLHHDKARRFITLIDEVYDAGVRLHFTAERPPGELFRELSAAEAAGQKGHLGTDHGWKGGIQVVDSIGVTVPPMRTPVTPSSGSGVNEAYRSGVDAAEDQLKVLEGELSSVQELRFAFQRAASRLTEMTGQDYFQKWNAKRQL
jgi:predicted ATPase